MALGIAVDPMREAVMGTSGAAPHRGEPDAVMIAAGGDRRRDIERS